MGNVHVPKILCHPDGAIFCDYYRASAGTKAQVVYLSDEFTPPAATTLGIVSGGMPEIDDLIWLPVVIAVAEKPEYIDQIFPYDDEDGEAV